MKKTSSSRIMRDDPQRDAVEGFLADAIRSLRRVQEISSRRPDLLAAIRFVPEIGELKALIHFVTVGGDKPPECNL